MKKAQPCAVILTMRDGSILEQVFSTRFQAETFLYLLPLLMTTQPDGDKVASAILSPLVEDHVYDPIRAASPSRYSQFLQ